MSDNKNINLFASNIFKDQISFRRRLPEKHLDSIRIPGNLRRNVNNFIPGFLQNKVTKQIEIIIDKFFSKKENRIVLELPPYCGKTTATFVSAFLHTYNHAINSLIIYPNEEQRNLASKIIQKNLKEVNYHKYSILKLIDNQSFISSKEILQPKIYITDVYSLHNNILTNINFPEFWALMGFIAIENFEDYTDNFASNCAYLFRRLLARLEQYRTEYSFLATNSPIKNRLEVVSKLTGINIDDFDTIINVNTTHQPSQEIIHWYPPVNSIKLWEKDQFHIEIEDFHEELQRLIKYLVEKELSIAILWDKSLVTDDDIANITQKYEISEEPNCFIGNSLNQIRQILVKDDKDFDDIKFFLIVGLQKPLKTYLNRIKYLGAESNYKIFYSPQYPGLQKQIYDILENDTSLFNFTEITENKPKIDLKNEVIIDKHIDFLENEYTSIPVSVLNKYFNRNFIDRYNKKENRSKSGYYLYLNKNIKFIPGAKRSDSDLLYATQNNLFSIIDQKNEENLGKLPLNYVKAYCYPKGRFIHKNERFLVNNVDYSKNEIIVRTLEHESLATYKFSSYEINGDKQEWLDTYGFQNGLIKIQRGWAEVSEKILGVKRSLNYTEFDEDLYENAIDGFQKLKTRIIKLNCDELINLVEFEETINGEDQARINHIRKILHTIAHLLLESIKTKININTDEIKIKININANEYSLYFIDLTGFNESFSNQFEQGSIKELFEISEEILKKCPCERGCRSCIAVDYCNIAGCNLTNLSELNKLDTLDLISKLLNRRTEIIQLAREWKENPGELNINSAIGRDHETKKDEMENLAKAIIENKGLIKITNYYNSLFLTDLDINDLPITESTLAITLPRKQQIKYRPGLFEQILYTTIFYQRFHNYQFINNNFNDQLTYFNWDNIDDPENIPFAGDLVKEGSAVWFSIRMMEIFSDLEFFNYNIYNEQIRVHLAGLKVILQLEKIYGYYRTIKYKLKNGFNIKDFEQTYRTEINQQLNNIIHPDLKDTENTPIHLYCLQDQELLDNLNRTSFYLYYNSYPNIIDQGINELIRSKKKYNIAHVSNKDIRRVATTAMELALRNEVRTESLLKGLRKTNLIKTDENNRNYILCEECHDRDKCQVFTCCMLNGGRKHFVKLLLSIYGEGDHKNSFFARVKNVFFRRNEE